MVDECVDKLCFVRKCLDAYRFFLFVLWAYGLLGSFTKILRPRALMCFEDTLNLNFSKAKGSPDPHYDDASIVMPIKNHKMCDLMIII